MPSSMVSVLIRELIRDLWIAKARKPRKRKYHHTYDALLINYWSLVHLHVYAVQQPATLCVCLSVFFFFYSAVTLRACPALTWIQDYGKDHGAKGRGERRERKPFGSKVNLALCTHSFSVSIGLDTNRFAPYQWKERPTCYLVKLDTLSTSDSRM